MNNYTSASLLEKYIDPGLVDKYINEVARANSRFSLYSRNLKPDDLRPLIAESLLPLELGWIDENSGRILDIGSGWGIPAIPVLLSGARLDYSLSDRSQKKADFLALLCHRLKLTATIVAQDLAVFRPEDLFSLITLRRVALDDKLIAQIRRLTLQNSAIIYFGAELPQTLEQDAQVVNYSIDASEPRRLIKVDFS